MYYTPSDALFDNNQPCTTATLYYSSTDNKTYYQAEQFCNRVGGVLLRYGGRFSEVIRTCGKFQTDVWTGKPWYRKWENCYYDGNINTLRTTVVNRTADKHVAACADFCANENYTCFAVQTKSCFCYNEGVTFTASFCYGQTIQCPGNSNDVCGTGEYGSFPYYVVYEKVGSSDDIKCNFNDLLQSKSSTNNVTAGKGLKNGQTSKSIMRPENNDLKKNQFSLYASVSEETIISGNVLSNDQANLVSSDSINAKTDHKFNSFDNTKTSNTEKEDHYEIKPDGVYDVSSHNAMNKMDAGNDNIYDRQLEDTYDTGNLQNINQIVDVYDHIGIIVFN
ncbi:unnamed protein product [Mytilus coruscus]|uniref:WSC domain-containing protein n=1 Tax=Mytilus coruscus TaxID=42192 RepID=A0A6J8EF05_MYTCO|nr:unnamed protein product [Mytilus coruscus]